MDLCLMSFKDKADSPKMQNFSEDLNCDGFMAEAECEEKEGLEIKKRNIKGWNLHTQSYCHLAAPYGKVKFVFMSKDKKCKKTVILSKKNYKLVILPPNIWFSFESLEKISIVGEL